MGKRRSKQQQPTACKPAHDPTTRSIAVHGHLVAVAAGRRWRVVDVRSGAVLASDASHEGPVRGLAFSPDGAFLLTCSDDKTARVWATSDWRCMHQLKAPKKATCCTFSADSRHVFFADRFGDVLCSNTTPAAGGDDGATAAVAAAAPAPAADASVLLGHLQSILTSLTCCSSGSGSQQLLVSTDKDCKVRASVLPADPTKGAHEIQSYCLGHTKFVTCSAAVPQQQQQQPARQLLLSGAGDGSVRLWDVDSGKELSCYVASELPPPPSFQLLQQQLQGGAQHNGEAEDDGGEAAGSDGDAAAQQAQQDADGDSGAAAAGEGGVDAGAAGAAGAAGERQGHRMLKTREACCAVLSLAVSPDGATVGVAVEGQQELQLLALDAAAGSLSLQQKLQLPDVANPAALVFDAAGRLWVAGGVLMRETESLHVGVAARPAAGAEFESVTASALPTEARTALELRVEAEEQQQQEGGADAGYYFEGVKKAVYLADGDQQPKRVRKEERDIERLRALAAAQEAGKQQK